MQVRRVENRIVERTPVMKPLKTSCLRLVYSARTGVRGRARRPAGTNRAFCVSKQATTVQPAPLRNEALFAALDGLVVHDAGGVKQTIEVVGIIRSATDVWVQVAPAGRPVETVVVRLSECATPDQAVAAVLEQWTSTLTHASRRANAIGLGRHRA